MAETSVVAVRSRFLWMMLQRGFKRDFLAPDTLGLTAQTKHFRQKPSQEIPITSAGFKGEDVVVNLDPDRIPQSAVLTRDGIIISPARLKRELKHLQADGTIYRGQRLYGGALRIAGIEKAEDNYRLLLETVDPHDPDIIITPYFTEPHDLTRREELINVLVQKINHSQHRVWVAVFAFTNERLRQALAAAKQRGVDVRVIMDAAQAAKSNSQKEALERGSCKVLTGDLTMHHKFCLIDYDEHFIGSFNWTSANIMNYEDYTSYRGKDASIQKTIDVFESRFRNLWETFLLGQGTIVPPGRLSPLLEGLGFYAFGYDAGIPLEWVKLDEIFLGRLTEYEFRKLAELHQRGGYTFRLSRHRLLKPLIGMIEPQYEYLRGLVHVCLADLPPSFRNNYLFFGPASPSKRHHKAHVNRLGGVLVHHRETAEWVEIFAGPFEADLQTLSEARAAALLHDPFPPSKVEAEKARRTAESLEGISRKFRRSLRPEKNRSIERVLAAVRNQLHIWGETPITKESPLVDKLLFLANLAASRSDLYLKKDLEDRDILRELLERPFPNPYTTYARLLDGDADFERITGRREYRELGEDDKKVLTVAYALMPSFVLSPPETRIPNREQYLLTEKAAEVKALLLESLALRRSGRATAAFTAPALANLICQNEAVEVFTYDRIQRELASAESPQRAWAIPVHPADELTAFSPALQEVMLEEFSGEFIPDLEQGFRRLLNRGCKKSMEPIWEGIILWMVKKSRTLDPEKLYQVFWGSLRTEEQRRRFIEILEDAAYKDFEGMGVQMLERLLRQFRANRSSIPSVITALSCHPALGKRKSLKEIRTVLQNSGLRQRDIGTIMHNLTSSRPQDSFRYICEINLVLTRAKVKNAFEMVEALAGHDLKEVETLGQKVSRVLKEAGVDEPKARGAERRVQAALAEKTAFLIQQLETLFEGVSFPDPTAVIPELEIAATALYTRSGAMDKAGLRSYLTGNHGFGWRKIQDPAILQTAQKARRTVEQGQKITVYAPNDLRGTIGAAMVVEALKQEAEIYFRQHNPKSESESISDYEDKVKRYVQGKIDCQLLSREALETLSPEDGGIVIREENQAFGLARAINPTEGLDCLDLASLQILTGEKALDSSEKAKVFWGLQLLNTPLRKIGLNTLLEAKDLSSQVIDEGIVGFQILPVLKAGCQKGKAERVMELLLADNKVSALAQLEVLMKLETEIATDSERPDAQKTEPEPLAIDAELDLGLVSKGLESLINAIFGPFNPDNQQGVIRGKPVFLVRGVSVSSAGTVGKYNSHRSMLISRGPLIKPAFWRRANTSRRWQETGRLLFENDGKPIEAAVSIGSFRKGERVITNLEIADLKGRPS